MIPWKGPVVALVVAVALFQIGPERSACVLSEHAVESPPLPPLDMARLSWSGSSGAGNPLESVDPFGLGSAPPAKTSNGASHAAAAPPRPWRVTGIVGGRSAVLTRPDGSSVVVSAGQKLDSIRVIEITVSGVELEDRGGRFLLKVR